MVIIGFTNNNPAINTKSREKSAINATDVANTPTVIRSTPVVSVYINLWLPCFFISVNDFLNKLEVKFADKIALFLLKKNMTFLLKYKDANVFTTIKIAASKPKIAT